MAFEFSVFDAYFDGENIWFAAIEYNALWRKRLNDDTLEYVGSFPNEKMLQWRLYTSVCEHRGKLYFIPGAACEIGVYDISEKKFSKINIGIKKEENDTSDIRYLKKYVSAFVIDDKLVMIPCCYDKIIMYDLNTEIIEMDSSLFELLKEKYKGSITSSEGKFYLCWNAKIIDKENVVFDLHSNTNTFVKYNMSKNTWVEYSAGDKGYSYNFIEYQGGNIWLYDDKKMLLISYSMKDEEYETFNLPVIGKNMLFSNMFAYGEYLFFLSASGKSVIRFSLENRTFDYVEELVSKDLSFSSVAVKNNDFLCLYAPQEQSFVICQNDKWKFLPCKINRKNMIKLKDQVYLEMRRDGKVIVVEGADYDTDDFIRIIQYGNYLTQRDSNRFAALMELSGKKIYKYMINGE